jgi:ferredoxin
VKCEPRRTLEALKAFADDGMCGRCLPCPIATRQSIAILERMVGGRGEIEDLARLVRISVRLADAARCPRGEETARTLGESLQNSEEYEAHLAGRCIAGTCRALVRFRVVPERCTMCGRCQEACPHGAIAGEPYVAYLGDNRPYVIRKKKCDGCGKCLEICPEDAIERVT